MGVFKPWNKKINSLENFSKLSFSKPNLHDFGVGYHSLWNLQGPVCLVQALEVQDQTKWLVFRMIHIKDSPLPMGKVWWAWTPWAGFFFATLQGGLGGLPLWMFENRQRNWSQWTGWEATAYWKKAKVFFFRTGEWVVESRNVGGLEKNKKLHL